MDLSSLKLHLQLNVSLFAERRLTQPLLNAAHIVPGVEMDIAKWCH